MIMIYDFQYKLIIYTLPMIWFLMFIKRSQMTYFACYICVATLIFGAILEITTWIVARATFGILLRYEILLI